MGTLGADVSHWQSSTPTAGLSFLFVKATEGSGHVDSMYAIHVGRATAAGLLVGAYHFARNDADLAAQARFFVQRAAGAKALAIDVEGPHALNRTQTRTLLNLVRQYDSLHRHVGLYMSEGHPFYLNVGADFNWVANWSRVPSISWHIHQYTSTPYDKNRVPNQAVLDAIFQVKPPSPTQHVLHIAQNALIRIYRTRVVNGNRCIVDWREIRWTKPSTHANCSAPVRLATCDGKSGARTVIPAGPFLKGEIIRVGANGVTVS